MTELEITTDRPVARFDLTIVLSDAEARSYWRIWTRRQRRATGSASRWAVILLGLLAGLLAGLVAVVLGAVDAATGGLVAMLGFLTFWSGAWTVSGLSALATRRALRVQTDRLRRERQVSITDDGVAVASDLGTSRWAWPGIQAVSEEAGLILLWLEAGALPIPRRVAADAEALLTFLRGHLAAKP